MGQQISKHVFKPNLATYSGAGGELLYVRQTSPDSAPEPASLPLVWLTTSKGEEIPAVYMQSTNVIPTFTLLLSHGNMEDISIAAKQASLYAEQCGCDVFLYEYTGYGLSTGKPSEEGCYADIEAAYNYLVDDMDVNPTSIILFGRSIGSGPTTWLSSRKKVGGVVLVTPFLSCIRTVQNSHITTPFDIFPNIDRIHKIRAMVLIIHGRKDELVPFEHGVTLYKKARRPTTPLWIDDAMHNDIETSFGKEVLPVLIDFFRQVELDAATRELSPKGRSAGSPSQRTNSRSRASRDGGARRRDSGEHDSDGGEFNLLQRQRSSRPVASYDSATDQEYDDDDEVGHSDTGDPPIQGLRAGMNRFLRLQRTSSVSRPSPSALQSNAGMVLPRTVDQGNAGNGRVDSMLDSMDGRGGGTTAQQSPLVAEQEKLKGRPIRRPLHRSRRTQRGGGGGTKSKLRGVVTAAASSENGVGSSSPVAAASQHPKATVVALNEREQESSSKRSPRTTRPLAGTAAVMPSVATAATTTTAAAVTSIPCPAVMAPSRIACTSIVDNLARNSVEVASGKASATTSPVETTNATSAAVGTPADRSTLQKTDVLMEHDLSPGIASMRHSLSDTGANPCVTRPSTMRRDEPSNLRRGVIGSHDDAGTAQDLRRTSSALTMNGDGHADADDEEKAALFGQKRSNSKLRVTALKTVSHLLAITKLGKQNSLRRQGSGMASTLTPVPAAVASPSEVILRSPRSEVLASRDKREAIESSWSSPAKQREGDDVFRRLDSEANMMLDRRMIAAAELAIQHSVVYGRRQSFVENDIEWTYEEEVEVEVESEEEEEEEEEDAAHSAPRSIEAEDTEWIRGTKTEATDTNATTAATDTKATTGATKTAAMTTATTTTAAMKTAATTTATTKTAAATTAATATTTTKAAKTIAATTTAAKTTAATMTATTAVTTPTTTPSTAAAMMAVTTKPTAKATSTAGVEAVAVETHTEVDEMVRNKKVTNKRVMALAGKGVDVERIAPSDRTDDRAVRSVEAAPTTVAAAKILSSVTTEDAAASARGGAAREERTFEGSRMEPKRGDHSPCLLPGSARPPQKGVSERPSVEETAEMLPGPTTPMQTSGGGGGAQNRRAPKPLEMRSNKAVHPFTVATSVSPGREVSSPATTPRGNAAATTLSLATATMLLHRHRGTSNVGGDEGVVHGYDSTDETVGTSRADSALEDDDDQCAESDSNLERLPSWLKREVGILMETEIYTTSPAALSSETVHARENSLLSEPRGYSLDEAPNSRRTSRSRRGAMRKSRLRREEEPIRANKWVPSMRSNLTGAATKESTQGSITTPTDVLVGGDEAAVDVPSSELASRFGRRGSGSSIRRGRRGGDGDAAAQVGAAKNIAASMLLRRNAGSASRGESTDHANDATVTPPSEDPSGYHSTEDFGPSSPSHGLSRMVDPYDTADSGTESDRPSGIRRKKYGKMKRIASDKATNPRPISNLLSAVGRTSSNASMAGEGSEPAPHTGRTSRSSSISRARKPKKSMLTMTVDATQFEVASSRGSTPQQSPRGAEVVKVLLPESTMAKLNYLRLSASRRSPYPYDDTMLLKFLRGRKFDSNSALKTLVNYENLMLTLGFRPHEGPKLEDVEHVLRRGILHIPGTTDAHGNPLLVMRPGKQRMAEVAWREVLRATMYMVNEITQQEEVQRRGFTVIADLADFSNLSIDHVKEVFYAMQQNYPARIRNVLIVDGPARFFTIWKMIRPLMTKHFAEKWQLYCKRDNMDRYVNRSDLPDFLGGYVKCDTDTWIAQKMMERKKPIIYLSSKTQPTF